MSERAKAVDEAFQALADATRRDILDLLRRRGTLPAGAIAAAYPEISRPAVSRHLRVLREAGLVIADESGRERHYRLNVAAFARVQRDWFARFAPLWERSLEQLKSTVEGEVRQKKAL
ncbi:MAG TPA: metalloregulator ArsR/SmtB family transcription factor [Dehalococcoidia bacterium]|nr:metalloregulator ArsR/SmtB family transcription factor [Dehalococcoidia bacterium]